MLLLPLKNRYHHLPFYALASCPRPCQPWTCHLSLLGFEDVDIGVFATEDEISAVLDAFVSWANKKGA